MLKVSWYKVSLTYLALAAIELLGTTAALAVYTERYIATEDGPGRFALAAGGEMAALVVSERDWPGVVRVARHLQADIERVTGNEPRLSMDRPPAGKNVVLIGTLGKSPLIDRLVDDGKLNVAGLAGRWEKFLIDMVDEPLPGVDRALVIVGSDKRGTIFGMFDLSAQIGVSPWYWWADVPVERQDNLYVLPGRRTDEPAVKYRGFFINDEAPALSGWAHKTYGGFNHEFYDRVFELILRMKGNYLWPAMWGRSLFDDDPRSAPLADEYGIVIGTSHHEPMMRAHVEWARYGEGPWNYDTNEEKLRQFWREGIERMGSHESIVTVGMRGDGDEPMTRDANIALLERIIADQREILTEVTGRDPAAIPQMWALYKEVQEYYDRGMRVPDDVTLMLCDDNWGNIRKLPKLGDRPRAGGYGIYYHYDYVGGPRNYKWLNTNQIARVWEQMHLAYQYGADRMWIVNVGDIKPMEFPTEFFLDYAWDPNRWPAERLPEYTRLWAEQQFGSEHGAAIAEMLTAYTRFNSRRKPELLAPETYSLVHYREAERIADDYNRLTAEAEAIGELLPEVHRDAYFQLVLYPIKASAVVNDLYVTVAKNRLYAKQGRAATNALAERARELFAQDAELTRYYNDEMAGGKWAHMMDQTRIGYTYWQQPERNVMPDVEEIDASAAAEMGVAIEGSEDWWPGGSDGAAVLEFDPFQTSGRYFEIFNRGSEPFHFMVEPGAPWLNVTPSRGTVEDQQRIEVTVDWQQTRAGRHEFPITIYGPDGSQFVIQAVTNNPTSPPRRQIQGFVESDGYVSIEAENFTRAIGVPPIRWQRIPDFGRTLSGMTPLPVTAESQTPGDDSPRLEYRVHLFNAGEVNVRAYVSPTLNFHDTEGLRYAVSFNDQPPQIVNIHTDTSLQAWEQWVRDNANATVTTHQIDRPGTHVLKFWMVDPAVVLQKLVIETRDIPPSYLGPPESPYHGD